MQLKDVLIKNGFHFNKRYGQNLNEINELRNHYDIVILDCPPILGISDTQIMTKYSDANVSRISSLIEVKLARLYPTISSSILPCKNQKNNYTRLCN